MFSDVVALGALLLAASTQAVIGEPSSAPSSPPAAATASAAPAPAAGREALREIGRVRALTPFCKATIEHADAAVGTTLGNDARIAFTVANLKTIDLDTSMLAKLDGTKDLRTAFVALRAAAVRATEEAKQVAADADKAPTADQKAQLVGFAQALGGAASRQKRIADDLGSYIAYLDTHPNVTQADRDQQEFDIQLKQNQLGSAYRGDPRDYLTPTLNELAKAAAKSFEESSTAVAADESHASTFVEPAFGPCK